MDREQYLQERLEDQIKWYGDKSRSNQNWSKTLRGIEIVSAAFIPFIAGYSEVVPSGNVIMGFLGVVIAVCAGMAALNKYQENWLMYRTTCEALRHEKFLFLTKTIPYDAEGSFSQFVTRVENLISKENAQWAGSSKEKSDKKASQ